METINSNNNSYDIIFDDNDYYTGSVSCINEDDLLEELYKIIEEYNKEDNKDKIMNMEDFEKELSNIKDRYYKAIKREILYSIVDDIYSGDENYKYLLNKITRNDLDDMTNLVVNHDWLSEQINYVIKNAIEEISKRRGYND